MYGLPQIIRGQMLPDIDVLTSQAIATVNQLLNLRKFQEAELICQQLIKVAPDSQQAKTLLGLTYMNSGNHAAALEQFRFAVTEDDPESHNNLALALAETGNSDEAIKHYEKAIELAPENPNYYNNFGLECRIRGQLAEAIECFEHSLYLKKDKFTLLNYGSTLLEEKRVNEALDIFEMAVQLDQSFAPAHISVAYCLFLLGDWKNGWAEYEYRFNHYPQAKTYRRLFTLDKQWDGLEDLNGKKIILYGEQGIGDIFHFIRYAKLLKEAGAAITLHCAPALNDIFTQQEYIDNTLNVGRVDSPLPLHDYHVSLLSLPHILGHPKVPACPYMVSEKAEMKQYERYFKIGIVWAGNAEHPHDSKRSCPLRFFQPIHDLDGVKLFSFQWDLRLRKYHRSDKTIDYAEGAENLKVVHLGYHIKDWADTAALLQNMDLVISVDTAVLHLAGALGIPTMALLSYVPDWRWLIEGDKTIWYENMQLFRQETPGDWEPVLQRVAREVKKKRPA
jgi:tetratricopeptide (TPR) repeat protein